MKEIKIKLIVKKTENEVYQIFLGNVIFDYFRFNDCPLKYDRYLVLNGLLKLNLPCEELQTYLIENYLEKDVEDMTNEEFAEYLIENVGYGLRYIGYKTKVVYKDKVVYSICEDNINYSAWHNGLLWGKTSFCNFDGDYNVKSKGSRKKFVNNAKLVIEHLENYELKLEY